MKDLIYYPTFEPTDTNWLKYALIYIDNFSPIIPPSGRSQLSDDFKMISYNSDLINIKPPQPLQGFNASTKVLTELEKIQMHPDRYSVNFNTANIIDTLTERDNWQFKIYEEKFSSFFKEECIKNRWGREVNGGLMTSKQLAYFFMTFLADEMAYEYNGNPITDMREFDNLLSFLRSDVSKNCDRLSAAQAITEFSLPQNIQHISLAKLLEFRNKKGIEDLRKSFNNTLDTFYSSVEQGFDLNAYLIDIKKINWELTKEIGDFFGGIAATVLGATILIHNPADLEIYKQTIEGTAFTILGISNIRKAWIEGKEKRAARKFVSQIEYLQY